MPDSLDTILARVRNGYYPADITAHNDLRRLAAEVERLQFLLWHRHAHHSTPLTAEEQDHITAHLKRPASI